MKLFYSFFVVLLLPISVNAGAAEFEQLDLRSKIPLAYDPVPIVDAYISQNGEKLVATTRLPNSCYHPWSSIKKVEDDEIRLFHIARYQEGQACARIIDYETVVFSLENVADGTYEVIDGDRQIELGEVELD